jgi:hypothetical protein
MTRAAFPPLRALILALAPVLAGCTGLEPALLTAGFSVAQTGVSILDGQDTRSFEFARFDDVLTAADRAAAVLKLHQHSRRQIGPQRILTTYQNRRGARWFVEIRAETDTVTQVRTEIRSSAGRGLSALFLRQMYEELNRADAYLEHWARSPERASTVTD